MPTREKSMDKWILRKRSSLYLLAAFSMLLPPLHAFAAPQSAEEPLIEEPLITDRPDFTESTETVPAGMTQVEGGYTYSRVGEEKQHTYGELLIRQSLGRKTELRLEVPSYARVSNPLGNISGFEDGSIGFKVMLTQGSGELGLKKPRVSLIGATSLPIGSRDFREKKLQPEVKLLLGWDLTDRVALSSNLNYAYLSEDGDRFSELSGSVSLGFSLSDRVGSYVEVFGFRPGGDRSNTKFINGGFTYLVNNSFQLDARLGCGLGNHVEGPDYFFGVGVARRF
jgi:hypothetical protein